MNEMRKVSNQRTMLLARGGLPIRNQSFLSAAAVGPQRKREPLDSLTTRETVAEREKP